MVCVSGRAIACYFRIDMSATGAGVLDFLEDQDCGAFADDEPVASFVERTGCVERCWI